MRAKDGVRRAPTESDVAKLAGVSQSAVSRAYTPGASVAEATRDKILKAAKEIGYQPNMMARTLATNRSNIVALAISYLENPFYAQVVRELSEKLRETGRHILLFTTSPDGKADPALENVLSYQVDALILTATTASHDLATQCQAAGVPIVQINRESKLPGISTVRGQNALAGSKIAEFLFEGGHSRFAFVGGTLESGTSKVRENAFVKRLTELGVKDVMVKNGDYTFEGAASATRELLSRNSPPDAIFCASDYMAFATIDVAKREFDLDIPNQLSVVGFDNVPAAGRFAYDLTTYSQPAALLVDAAIEIIDTMIAKPGRRAQRREVSGELVLRGSAKRSEQ